jgi:hypothetical protein
MEDYIMVSFRKNVLARILALGIVFVGVHSFVGAMNNLLTCSKIIETTKQIEEEQFNLIMSLQNNFKVKQNKITSELEKTIDVLNKTYIYLFNLGKLCNRRLPKNITLEQQVNNINNNENCPVIVTQLFELLVRCFHVEQAEKILFDQQKEIETPEQLKNSMISATNAITRITEIKSMFKNMKRFVGCLENKQPRIRNLKEQRKSYQKNNGNYESFLVNMQELLKVTCVPKIIQQLQNSLNILTNIQIPIQNDIQKIMAYQGASKCNFWIGWEKVVDPFFYEHVQLVLYFVYNQCLNCSDRIDEIKKIESLQKEQVKELRTKIFEVFSVDEISKKSGSISDNEDDMEKKQQSSKIIPKKNKKGKFLFTELQTINTQTSQNINIVVLQQKFTKIEASIKEQELLNKVKKQQEKQKIDTQLLKLKEEYECQQKKKPQNLKLQQNNNLNSQSLKFKSALLNFAKIGITPALAILYAYYVINIKSFK